MTDFPTLLSNMDTFPPLDDAAIDAELAKKFPAASLPPDYREFMRYTNGIMGPPDPEPGFISLHPLDGSDDSFVTFDEDGLPGRVMIGYNGGSYYYAVRPGGPPMYVEIAVEECFEERDLGPTMADLLSNRTVVGG